MFDLLVTALVVLIWWAFIGVWLHPMIAKAIAPTRFGRWMERLFLKLARFLERAR